MLALQFRGLRFGHHLSMCRSFGLQEFSRADSIPALSPGHWLVPLVKTSICEISGATEDLRDVNGGVCGLKTWLRSQANVRDLEQPPTSGSHQAQMGESDRANGQTGQWEFRSVHTAEQDQA